MVAAQAGFAGMNVFARAGGRTLPWQEVSAARFLVGLGVALAIARARGAPLRIADRRTAWLRSVFGTLAAVCTFYSLTSPRIHLGDAATLGATAPIFVALLSPFVVGERVGRMVPLAALVAFGGVALILEPAFASAADVVAVATLGAALYALAMLFLRRLGGGESHEAVVVHFSATGLVTMTLLSIPVWRTPTLREAGFLLGTGLAAGFAQLAMTRAYALDRAARVATLMYLGIVFTHLLAIPAFGERPGEHQVAGALCVIASGLLLAWSAARQARRA